MQPALESCVMHTGKEPVAVESQSFFRSRVHQAPSVVSCREFPGTHSPVPVTRSPKSYILILFPRAAAAAPALSCIYTHYILYPAPASNPPLPSVRLSSIHNNTTQDCSTSEPFLFIASPTHPPTHPPTQKLHACLLVLQTGLTLPTASSALHPPHPRAARQLGTSSRKLDV